jgi:hypothetical protein
MTTSSETPNRKAGAFGRLFKRKKHVPLSQQDTCSVSIGATSAKSKGNGKGKGRRNSKGKGKDHIIRDDDDESLDDENGFSNGNSACSSMDSIYSINLSINSGSDKENGSNHNSKSHSISNNRRNSVLSATSTNTGTSASAGRRRSSLLPVSTLHQLELQDINTSEDQYNLLSPPTLDLDSKNVSMSPSDLENIPSFHDAGCNPFQQNTWKFLTTNQQNQQNQINKQNNIQKNNSLVESLTTEESKSTKNKKKGGYLQQMKAKVKKQTGAKSSNLNMPKNSTPRNFSVGDNNNKNKTTSTSNSTSVTTSTSTSVTDEKKKFQISETPKFTNKSINVTTTGSGSNENMILGRSALSRPFGRTSLPSHLAKKWCVEVSPYYDTSLKNWSYHILVQREEYSTSGSSFLSPIHSSANKDSSGMHNKSGNGAASPNSVIPPDIPTTPMRNEVMMSKSFAAANVTRSLKDIVWLERALRDEFHGALIFPSLSMTLTSGTDWTTAVKLDKETFDRGEWDPATLSEELLEAVLDEEGFYDLGEDEEKEPPFDPKFLSDWFSDILNGVRGKGELILNYSSSRMVDIMHSEAMESFFYKVKEPLVDLHFMKKKGRQNWLPINLDLGSLAFKDNSDDTDDGNCTMKGLMTFPMLCLSNMNSCHSGATDSVISTKEKHHSKQRSPEFWQRSMLSDELKVQSYYIGLQRENTLRSMYRLRILLEKEALVSAAWKRFAISLSNLFTAGKDIESCKVGDSKGKKDYSKVSKEKVDDSLRVLARQKVDRATPSLKVLSGMLSAYYADFSSVNSSLTAFTDGLKKLERERQAGSSTVDENWKQALKAVSPLTLFQDTDGIKDTQTIEMEKRVFEQRQSFNESLMKSSLTQLCNSIDIRVSRMSWKLFKMEAGQASLLSNAAEQVLGNLNKELQEEESFGDVHSDDFELGLIKRFLDLGSKRKYKYNPYPKSSSSSHTDSDSDLMSENGSAFMDDSVTENTASVHNPLVDKIMDRARDRIGRWDAELTLSILKMSGDENAEILIEDCTREVRTVQRLAESLQAQVNRCSDAIEMLKEVSHSSMILAQIDALEQLSHLFYFDTSNRWELIKWLVIDKVF